METLLASRTLLGFILIVTATKTIDFAGLVVANKYQFVICVVSRHSEVLDLVFGFGLVGARLHDNYYIKY